MLADKLLNHLHVQAAKTAKWKLQKHKNLHLFAQFNRATYQGE